MATRNPMNERYTTDQVTGKTKRSASSAKPKRKAGETVTVQSSGSESSAAGKSKMASKAAKQQEKQKDTELKQELVRRYGRPTGPEYQKWTKVWIVMLVIALVASLMTYGVYVWFDAPMWVEIMFMVIAYGFVIAAFWVDIARRSPIRKAAEAAALSMSGRERKAAIKEIEAEKAAKAEKKQQQGGFLSKLSPSGREAQKKAADVDAMIEQEKEAATETQAASGAQTGKQK